MRGGRETEGGGGGGGERERECVCVCVCVCVFTEAIVRICPKLKVCLKAMKLEKNSTSSG